MATSITQEEFNVLAEAAASDGLLKQCHGDHGKDFAVYVGSVVAATAVMNEAGEYEYSYHLYG